MTVNDLLAKNIEQNPDKTYVYFKNKSKTYGEFDIITNRVANGLISLGVEKGDRVSIMLQNSLEFLYAIFGCFKTGAVIVPLNVAYSPNEVEYAVNHSEAVILITNMEYLNKIDGVKTNLKNLKNIIIVAEEIRGKNMVLFSDLISKQTAERPTVEVKPEDNISIIYTSGTTAKPKGVLLTHSNYVGAARAWNESIGIMNADIPMSVLALFHFNAQVYFSIGAMDRNTAFVLEERFSSSTFWHRAVEMNATVSCLPGNALVMLDNMPPSEMDKINKMRIMISGQTPIDAYLKIEQRFNFEIIEGYTLTESGSALFNRPGDIKIGSIGRPMAGVKARIVDDEDNDVPQGEIGQIALKGPAVMKEYFKNPEATSEALRGGWLHTGDLGRVDEDGFFHYTGRSKDIIRRGGENIGAKEVEDVLNSHPGISESAVIPVPDRIRNEEVKAYIIPKPGEDPIPEEIIQYCNQRLSNFKVPRFIEFIDSFPRTAKMSIKKHELKDLKQDHSIGCFDANQPKDFD
ncbi:MAG: AMP-binding protein [Desulfobacterales bacterium]|jgi:carnitine-CoA ligase|nr:AMP-binding protein [Desulfobacteraceae bacterium]MBT7086614.1 AMP-binding protein [Desulfobacterales bacterium]MBT7696514.1 AMP-binding protein [Desulfobacterales bacterium]